MATEVLQSLDLLNQFLGQEKVRLEAENKQTRIDQTIANAASALTKMPANASQSDILTNQFTLIKEAATSEASEAIPLISSLYQAKAATAQYVKQEQDAEILREHLSQVSGVDLPEGFDPNLALTLLNFKRNSISERQTYNEKGQVVARVEEFNYVNPGKNKVVNEIMINPETKEQRKQDALDLQAAKNPVQWLPSGMVDAQGRDIIRNKAGQRAVYNGQGQLELFDGVTYNKSDWHKMTTLSSAERTAGEKSARADANAAANSLHNILDNLELDGVISQDLNTNWIEQRSDKKYQAILASIPDENALNNVLKEIDDDVVKNQVRNLWHSMSESVITKNQYAEVINKKLGDSQETLDLRSASKDISDGLSGAGGTELKDVMVKLIQARVPGAPTDPDDITESYFNSLNQETQNMIKREIMSAYE